ncbi:hypothetical protein [Streptosporangium sp. NPDC006930]|uniref:phage tail tube protein n=1 Tax=Streptosporangium sp. NPDC006930 TaxID=3154783 RepID=UPI00341A65FB
MAQAKVNARDLIVEVLDDDDTTWHRIENLKNATRNPGENEAVAETTDFDSEGAYEEEVMQRGSSLTLVGDEMEDDATGAVPVGRARIEALAGEDALGSDSVGKIRFRYPTHTNWKVWNCTVRLTGTGGDTNVKSAWGATIRKCGKTTLVAVS